MPMYEYKCQHCNITFTVLTRSDKNPCPVCQRDATRRFSFAIQPSFQDGYTPTTGGYVSSRNDLSEQLKRKSEELTERNGIEHRLVPVDFRDMDACGVTKEGIAENNETRIKQAEAAQKPPVQVEIRSK